jgi:hypothetical protein
VEYLLVVLGGKETGALAVSNKGVKSKDVSHSPLNTSESKKTGSNTSDNPVVPALVPVLVGQEADRAQDSNVN